MTLIQDHPWKNQEGVISARVAVAWWVSHCLFAGASATTITYTADLLAKDLESKGYP